MKFDLLCQGLSSQGNPIPVYATNLKPNQKALYLMAGTHGDEPEGIYVLDHLFHWLQQSFHEAHFPIIVIPTVNPDGVANKTRTNARGVDLNRNLPTLDWTQEAKAPRYYPGQAPLSEPENIFLVNLFDHYAPLAIISFHSWKPVIDYNLAAKKIAEFIAQYNQYEICDYIGYPTPGSFGTFMQEKYHAPVITFECPEANEEKTFELIWKENELALKSLFKEKFFENNLN
jgi:protein MpaA